jgi:nucleoid-associated protein YgaU
MSSNANSSSSSCTRFAGISPATILQNKHDMKRSIARAVIEAERLTGIDALAEVAAHLQISELSIRTEHGRTVISGLARYQLDRELFFDAVQQLDGWERDVVIDVVVERQDIRGFHTVAPGETLADIAELHLGDAGREMEIFTANRDRMNDPDQISPGQQLMIPRR